jgi:uncharacterized protein YfaS (alpha-2-macroglobulin family)
MSRVSGFTNTGISLSLPHAGTNTSPNSRVTISISDTPLQNPERVIASLIAYPYGCIEQTISSTMPNAVAIQLASSLGITIDTAAARKNLADGVAKILKMQDASGGWKYWENDTMVNAHVTPYVIRSLYEFRKLGVSIADSVFTTGLDYIANTASFANTNGINDGGSSDRDADLQAEIFATLAEGKHPRTQDLLAQIDTRQLSRHGYLIYSLGLSYLGKFDATAKKNLADRMSSRNSESYWYWDDTADQAIYARLLIQAGEQQRSGTMIANLLK